MKLIKFEIKEIAKNCPLLLDDFMLELESIKKILDSINKDVGSDKTSLLSYEIVKIRKNSPAYVELMPTAKNEDTGIVVESFYSGLKLIQHGKIPSNFSNSTVRAYSQLGKSTVRTKLTFIENGKGSKISVNESFEKYIEDIFKQTYYTESGSVSGKLDALNVHGIKKTITIYPNYSPAINCIVDEDLLPIIQSAIRKKVTVTGKIKTRIDEKYPYEIIVKEIKVHKNKEEIPSAEDLWGMVNLQINNSSQPA
jgi:hypothetical protein